MSAFTPGPWSLQHSSLEDGGFTIYRDGNEVIAHIPRGGQRLLRATTAVEAQTNGILLAAAPALYAALLDAEVLIDGRSPLAPDVRHKVRAALAMAEGRAP